MLCLNLPSFDPSFNLAVDEYLLKRENEEFLVTGINGPSVIIGENQVSHMESDTKFVTGRNIPVIRRISGGGAVFHDFGNLNFSFIVNSMAGRQADFRKFTGPIIEFLDTVNIRASFWGKNDLKVNDLKISGNAEYIHRDRVLHHGTLLFNSRLDIMEGSLRHDKSGYSSRAVMSNPSPVANLKDFNCSARDMNDFRLKLMEYFHEKNREIKIDDFNIAEIEALADSKYRTWEWNYAYGPEYQFRSKFNFSGKIHSVQMLIKDGIINKCDIDGSDEMADLAKKLAGCKHMVREMQEVFMNKGFGPEAVDVYSFF
ncbi:MAG: lipoate--protein ligase [Bacteroidales bacterium]|jgi:lipoate-protein ligase A